MHNFWVLMFHQYSVENQKNSVRRFSEKVKKIIFGLVLAYIVPIFGRSNQLSFIEFIERIKKT